MSVTEVGKAIFVAKVDIAEFVVAVEKSVSKVDVGKAVF